MEWYTLITVVYNLDASITLTSTVVVHILHRWMSLTTHIGPMVHGAPVAGCTDSTAINYDPFLQ